jgi:ABC-2 type transport system permease protein
VSAQDALGTPLNEGIYVADTGHGPSAIEKDLHRFLNLTVTLATTEFKLRYFGSVLGYLWSLMRPLLLFAVLYTVWTVIFKLGKDVPHYAVYLLTSIMLWTFFVEATSNSVQCLLAREGLLRKMRFPRLVIPLSVALLALFNLATNFIVVLAFAIGFGVEPRLSWLELPLLVVLLSVLAVGTGMLLSALYVRFRDIQPIWEVFTQMLFYGSPVIWTAYGLLREHPDQLHLLRLAMCNPIASILTQMGHAFISPSLGTAADYLGGTVRLLIPLGIIAVVFVVGLWFFNREAPRISENI